MVRRQRWSAGEVFDLVFIEGDPKIVQRLHKEAGGHRWQRVPPTERKGRVHTSTVTVAVLEGHQQGSELPGISISPSDIHERITKGTGPGGQNRNKRETAVILTHIPSGIEVKAETERTQENNRRVAMATLIQRVNCRLKDEAHASLNSNRKSQLGSGARGDKIRTYRSDGVTDHFTGKRAPLLSVLAGKLDLLI